MNKNFYVVLYRDFPEQQIADCEWYCGTLFDSYTSAATFLRNEIRHGMVKAGDCGIAQTGFIPSRIRGGYDHLPIRWII